MQFLDKVVDMPVVQRQALLVQTCDVEQIVASCHRSWRKTCVSSRGPAVGQVDDIRCCTTTGAWGLTVQKTVEVLQLALIDKVVDVFFVQFIDSVDVPVIMQRRVVSSTVEVPQIQFTARVVDIPVVQQRRGLASGSVGYGGGEGAFSTHFASFFALLRLSLS